MDHDGPTRSRPQRPSRPSGARRRSAYDRFKPKPADPSLFESENTPTVTKIEPDKRRAGVVVLRWERKRIAAIGAERAHQLGVRVGTPLDDRLLESLAREEAVGEARRYARRVVAARAMCRGGLVRRLTGKGLDAENARRIADELAELGAIDDRSFAESVARGVLSRRPAGRTFIVRTITSRGVDRQTAEAAADRVLDDAGVDPLDAATELARRKARTLPRSIDVVGARRRLYGSLARRGFAPDVVRRAVDDVVRTLSFASDDDDSA